MRPGDSVFKAPLPRAIPAFIPTVVDFTTISPRASRCRRPKVVLIAPDGGENRGRTPPNQRLLPQPDGTSPSSALIGARGSSRELSAGISGVVRELRRLVHLGPGDGAGRLGEGHLELRG